MDYSKMTAVELAKGVREGRFTALEVTTACLKRAKAGEPTVNACITLIEEKAIQKAKELDARIQRGENAGVLAGVPFFVKDNFCTRGIRTTCGSKMLENWEPTYDATAIKLMEDAGAILLGKANMDEFAMGSSTESSFFGPTKNPRDLTRAPGGSSGGSAAVVAAGYAPIALGSDTGGSVRQPAAFCGIHGFKPSYGQVSRYGVVGYASSLDQVSPFARSVEDLALVMDVLAKPDTRDTTCDGKERPSFTSNLQIQDLKGKRIGLFSGFDKNQMDPELYQAVEHVADLCREAGAVVEPIEMPVSVKYGVAAYYAIALADASSKLACFDGIRFGFHADGETLFDMYSKTRTEGFGEEVRKRILAGTCLLSTGYYQQYYRPALKIKTRVSEEFEEIFKHFDAYILPVSPSMPYPLGTKESDPVRMYLGDIFTVPISMAGVPGLSLNTGFNAQGLPLSVQLIGSRFGDADLLKIGALLEKTIGAPAITSIGEVA